MVIRLAIEDEVAVLTEISKAAFDTDISVGGTEIGGPPDYDNQKWHRMMLKENHLYSVLLKEQVIGGALLFRDKRNPDIMYVGRIFIDPKSHRLGYGIEMMKKIEDMFPEVLDWKLETPVWNIRTNRFYVKIGYKEVCRDAESVYYEKKIQRK